MMVCFDQQCLMLHNFDGQSKWLYLGPLSLHDSLLFLSLLAGQICQRYCQNLAVRFLQICMFISLTKSKSNVAWLHAYTVAICLWGFISFYVFRFADIGLADLFGGLGFGQ